MGARCVKLLPLSLLTLSFAIAGILSFIVVFFGIHIVEEGHIGVYFRTGALLPGTTEPGIHVKLPILTRYDAVQITMQTDKVTDIPVTKYRFLKR